MISHKYKCIFIHITKCAGTSIEQALGHYDKYSRGGTQDHRTIQEIKDGVIKDTPNPNNKFIVNKQQFNDYFKFTFVRNTWDRLYSAYENIKRDQQHIVNYNMLHSTTFKEFLRSNMGRGFFCRSQLWYIQDIDGSIPLDFIGRFENLQEDFDVVKQKLGNNNIHLPHINKGKHDGYKKAYDEETIELVRDFYKEEIALLGYTY